MNTPFPPTGESPESTAHSPSNSSWSWEPPGTSQSTSHSALESALEQIARPDGSDVADQVTTPRIETIQAEAPRSTPSRWGGLAFMLVLGAILGGAGGYYAARSGIVSTPTVAKSLTTTQTIIYNVTGVTGSTIETISSDGVPVLIGTTSTTSYQRAGFPAKLSDIKAGTRITVKGHQATKYDRTADRVLIVDAIVSGTIQEIASDLIEFKAPTGSITVALDASTQVYDARSHQPINPSSLHVGENATAYGAMLGSGAFGAAIITVSP